MKPVQKLVDQVGLHDNEGRWQIGRENRYEANDFSHTTLFFRPVHSRYLFKNASLVARFSANFILCFPDTSDNINHNAEYAKVVKKTKVFQKYYHAVRVDKWSIERWFLNLRQAISEITTVSQKHIEM